MVNAWRMALNHYAACMDAGIPYELPEEIAAELEKCSHRPYTLGFADGKTQVGEQAPNSGSYLHTYDLAAVVKEYNAETKCAVLEQRNRFFEGDSLEILLPGDIGRSLIVRDLRNEEGERIDSAPHPKQTICIHTEEPLKPGAMLRKRV